MRRILLTILVLAFCGGCHTEQANRITQTSTIDALLAGAFDGQMTCRQLLNYGNFGIGTFERLDGEMAVLNGKVYQIKANGKVYNPSLQTQTPFAAVCNFNPDKKFTIQSADFKNIDSLIEKEVQNRNVFLAIQIQGKFKYIKTRSVPVQNKPYPPLVEIARTQPEFEMNDIEGTLIGFRNPPYAKGLNFEGYHFHFLSSDFKQGGHVLEFDLISGRCQIDKCNEFLLTLPRADLLKNIDLSKDKTTDLQKAEKSK